MWFAETSLKIAGSFSFSLTVKILSFAEAILKLEFNGIDLVFSANENFLVAEPIPKLTYNTGYLFKCSTTELHRERPKIGFEPMTTGLKDQLSC